MRSEFRTPKTKRGNVWKITTGKEAGRWKWEVQLVRDDGSEFRKGGSRSTEADAIKARDAAYNEYNRTGGKPGKQYTVKSWCEYCLDGGMTRQNVKTRYHYRGWIKSRVYPEIGSIKLSKLTVPQLQSFYQMIQEKDVKSAAVRVRTALNACLSRAVEVGIIDRHPGRIARLKREEPNGLNEEKSELPGKRFLTIKEQETLVKQVEGTPLFFPVILGLYFGLRIAECCGLRWKDVDLEAKVIRVRWQVQRMPDGGGKKLIQLKTKNSVRTIPIPERLLSVFEQASVTAGNPEGFVSPTQVGTPFTPQELSIPFKRHCVEAKINNLKGQPDCTHHDLRSTFLTRLANEIMVSPATLRAIAGHGKIDTTYRYYIQASKEDLREAMSRV